MSVDGYRIDQVRKRLPLGLLSACSTTASPKHRLSNPGKIKLQLMEVASGSYLAEDDIVRFQDDFGRV